MQNKKPLFMGPIYGIILIFIILIITTANASCTEEIQDKDMHITVEKCRNIGTFSLGSYYQKWEKLTYDYPRPWKGTYLTIKVDDKLYSTSAYAKDGISMDFYIEEYPHITEKGISTRWRLPEGIVVEQILKLVPRGSIIKIRLTNKNSTNSFSVGARIFLDIMLGDNDGAPVYIPGEGIKTTESLYTGSSLNFWYWKAYDYSDNPRVTAIGSLSEKFTTPNKFIIANWKKSKSDSAWDYYLDPLRSTGDTAVILYYEPIPLTFNQIREIDAYYGKESCYDGIQNWDETDVDCGGSCSPCEEGSSCSIASDCISNYCYNNVCKIPTCFDGIQNQGEEGVDCGGPCKSCPPVMLILSSAILIIIIVILVFLLKQKKKAVKVTVEKVKKGDNVIITVTNKSKKELTDCTIEDIIPVGAEISVPSNVERKEGKLIWNVGKLGVDEKKTMKYKIKGVEISPRISFVSKEPVIVEVK